MQTSNNKQKKNAFTLVELIIVITILTILSTIAFVSFKDYIKDARDGNRITTLKNIEKGLTLHNIKTGNYPEPEEYVEVLSGTTMLLKQGIVGKTITRQINLNKETFDPKDNTNYIYSTTKNQNKYQLGAFLEENKFISYLSKTYADNIDYTNRYFYTLGDLIGIILESETNQPISVETYPSGNLNLIDEEVTFKVYFSNDVNSGSVTSSGNNLTEEITEKQNPTQAESLPVNLTCPNGFIHIPGSENIDSQTKGWCVAKYEMAPYSTIGWNQDSTFKGWMCTELTDSNLNNCPGSITSKSGTEPITYISKNEAQNACETNLKDQNGNVLSNGKLLTIELWKKISDDIINQGSNWSSGLIGSGNLSRGHSNIQPDTALKSGDDSLWTGKQAKSNGNFFFTREWTLSNGQNINDFSGNVLEWFYDNHSGTCTSSRDFTYNSNAYAYNGISLEPINSSLNSTYGVGKICSTSANVPIGTNYASLFGGSFESYTSAGVFSTIFYNNSPSSVRDGLYGFRCIIPAN